MTWVIWGAALLMMLLGSDVVWGHEAKAAYQEAVRAYSQHRDPEALDAVTRALSIYPNYAEAHFLLGLIAIRQNRVAEATEVFQKAVSIYPNFAEARYHVAAVLRQQH